MKLKTLFENEEDGTLIGKKINGRIVEPNMEKWNGNFVCECDTIDFTLTTLKGCPQKITGFFDCSYNNLKSLEYGPEYVGENFKCVSWNLTSLRGAPENIDGDFLCNQNKKLTSIEFCPKYIKGCCKLHHCSITSLHNIHLYIKSTQRLYVGGNKISSHMLGLLLIKELTFVGCFPTDIMNEPIQIINKYLEQPVSKQRMFDCQEELIQAGFKEYAQL